MVIARLRVSRWAIVRPGKKSTTRRSRLSSTPSPSAMAISVPITALVEQLMRCFTPPRKGA